MRISSLRILARGEKTRVQLDVADYNKDYNALIRAIKGVFGESPVRPFPRDNLLREFMMLYQQPFANVKGTVNETQDGKVASASLEVVASEEKTKAFLEDLVKKQGASIDPYCTDAYVELTGAYPVNKIQ